MSSSQGRMFDEFAKLMNDAAGVAQSARREVETVLRAQADRVVSEMDLVRREEIDVIRDLAAKAVAEVERLTARVAALEAKLADTESAPAAAAAATPPDGAGDGA